MIMPVLRKKMLSWFDFERICTKWINAAFRIMFEQIFIRVAQA